MSIDQERRKWRWYHGTRGRWTRFYVMRRGPSIEIAIGPGWISVYSWRRIYFHWKWTVL